MLSNSLSFLTKQEWSFFVNANERVLRMTKEAVMLSNSLSFLTKHKWSFFVNAYERVL